MRDKHYVVVGVSAEGQQPLKRLNGAGGGYRMAREAMKTVA